MERETITVTLPSGKNATLKAYLTTRERNEYRNVFFSNFKIGVGEKGAEVKELTGDVMVKAEEKLITSAVVSFDGSEEKILERLLDGKPEDYDALVVEAGKVTGANFQTAK
jgi:hypothetical protein